jgi:glycosyltransferase involved in cell wall biosynthesis
MVENPLRMSIVTPSLNQGDFIGEAIQSVALQQSSNVEHLIVDGGSGDGTLEILKQCSSSSEHRHVRWSSEPDGGQSDAFNQGLREATGELIGWLNSDDRYRPGSFAEVQRAFIENPDMDVLYGDYAVINENGRILKIRREIEFNRFVLMYHRVLYIATAATFFRRRVFTDGNWLNSNLHYAMDFDLFVRIAAAGYRIKHIPIIMADVRVHPASKSCAKTKIMLQERETLMRTYSGISKRSWAPMVKTMAYAGAKAVAGAMRYTEKTARGYYLGR